jgi:hypothetical protein
VIGGIGPAPSGSIVTGTGVVGAVELVGLVGDVDVVSVGLGSVVVGVVVVVVVVLGRCCTLVRGTQVYSGSGTNPGGTTAVSGAVGAGGGGW